MKIESGSRCRFAVRAAMLLLGALPVGLPAAMQPIANATAGGDLDTGTSGQFWYDTNHSVIRAQGGNILQVGSTSPTYYWYGFDYDYRGANSPLYYTSSDLSHWTFGGICGPGLAQYRGRPRVIYNEATGLYVMISEGPAIPGRNTVAYLTSPSPAGPFVFRNLEKVLNPSSDSNPGHATHSLMGDHNVFVDGKNAYLVAVCDDGGVVNGSLRIVQLAPDYLSQAKVTATLYLGVKTDKREAPCMMKRGPLYYVFTSQTHGWFGTETKYAIAPSLAGPWSKFRAVECEPASEVSFGTQCNMIISLAPGSVATCSAQAESTQYLYAGDRWTHRLGYGSGRAEWSPLSFDESGAPKMIHEDIFYLDAAAGRISAAAEAGPPGVPEEVTAKPGAGGVELSWRLCPGARSYSIRRSTDVAGPYVVAAAELKECRWIDRSAKSGQSYFYQLSAVNSAGESSLECRPQIEAKLGGHGGLGQLAAPTGVTARATDTPGQMLVRWRAVPRASSYTVARSTSSNGPYTAIIPIDTESTSLTDNKLPPGHTYYYVVSAVRRDPATGIFSDQSPESPEAAGTPVRQRSP